MKYTKQSPLRVVTVCSGYDSQCLGLERLKEIYPDFDYDLLAWAEIDPTSKQPMHKQPAIKAHNALFPQWKDRNLGDMTKIQHPVSKHFRSGVAARVCGGQRNKVVNHLERA